MKDSGSCEHKPLQKVRCEREQEPLAPGYVTNDNSNFKHYISIMIYLSMSTLYHTRGTKYISFYNAILADYHCAVREYQILIVTLELVNSSYQHTLRYVVQMYVSNYVLFINIDGY